MRTENLRIAGVFWRGEGSDQASFCRRLLAFRCVIVGASRRSETRPKSIAHVFRRTDTTASFTLSLNPQNQQAVIPTYSDPAIAFLSPLFPPTARRSPLKPAGILSTDHCQQ